jgi:hypothetical protein
MREVEYPGEWEVRRVASGGQIRWTGERVFVAHALQGEAVGLEQIDERHWRVWFSFHQIGVLDEEKLAIRRPERRAPKGEPDEAPG